jgi:hypothetical protein
VLAVSGLCFGLVYFELKSLICSKFSADSRFPVDSMSHTDSRFHTDSRSLAGSTFPARFVPVDDIPADMLADYFHTGYYPSPTAYSDNRLTALQKGDRSKLW